MTVDFITQTLPLDENRQVILVENEDGSTQTIDPETLSKMTDGSTTYDELSSLPIAQWYQPVFDD